MMSHVINLLGFGFSSSKMNLDSVDAVDTSSSHLIIDKCTVSINWTGFFINMLSILTYLTFRACSQLID